MRYILQEPDGDYVSSVESGDTETIKLHFNFTKDKKKARRFTYDDLWSKLAVAPVGVLFAQGYRGNAIQENP
jgi:hypothetical protein